MACDLQLCLVLCGYPPDSLYVGTLTKDRKYVLHYLAMYL